ncbi:MAG: thioesterase family protein [Eubacteriales bacterium]|nr:thioesterase family protein [Eubacteriales bacterium]
MYSSETKFIVRYAETDQMGIVHHSNYAVWFEAGRTDFLKKAGISNSSIELKGILLPLYEMNCQFKSPAKYEDEILVVTKLKSVSRVRLHFSYEVLNAGNNTLLATGETMHAWTMKELKPVNAEKVIPEVYSKLSEIIND